MMTVRFVRTMMTTAFLGGIFFTTAVQAHPGHAAGTMTGLLHPLTGLDHLLAMLAVGMWAAQLGKQARWAVPLSFVSIMALTAAAAVAGLSLPAVETGITGSLILAGLLIGLRVQVGVPTGVIVVALFALFHGSAHGLEMPASTIAWQYFGGFVFSTAILHGVGLLLASALMKCKAGLPITGALLFTSGSVIAGIA